MTHVKINYFPDGAKTATGTAVIIDTYRSSPVTCSLLESGIRKILPSDSIKEAKRMYAQTNKESYLLVGEEDSKTPKDFDFGNSLEELVKRKEGLAGKTAIQVSTNGLRGIKKATESDAEEILIGCPGNHSTLLKYLQGKQDITLIPVGEKETGRQRYAEEDMLYAEFLKDSLEGKRPDYEKVKKIILQGQSAKIGFKLGLSYDMFACLELDRFNVIPKLVEGKLININKEKK